MLFRQPDYDYGAFPSHLHPFITGKLFTVNKKTIGEFYDGYVADLKDYLDKNLK